MDHSATLHLTDKGTDEITHRTYKLGIKFRSVLLMLHTPHTVEFALQKSAFPKEEVIGTIDTLVQDGFVEIGAAAPATVTSTPVEKTTATAATAAPPAPVAATPTAITSVATSIAPTTGKAAAPLGELELDEEIVLSEAKFLLIDFAVDCFGMQAEKLTEDIRACRTVSALQALVKELSGMVAKLKPEHQAAFRDAIRAINETA